MFKLGAHDTNESAQFAANRLVKSLRIAASPIEKGTETSRAMYGDALEVIKKAIELDSIFRRSRAHFHVFITRVKQPLVAPPSFGFAFDSETMECVKELPVIRGKNSSGQMAIVDLAVAPGIIKAGNSDGTNYESERVLVKLQALCNLQETLAFLNSPPEIPETPKVRHRTRSQARGSSGDDVDMIVVG